MAMEDIISQGKDRPPGGRRRRLVVIAVIAVLAGVAVAGHLPHGGGRPAHRHRSAPERASLLPVINRGPVLPGGITGPVLPVRAAVRLPRTGARPTWYWPALDRAEPIRGLPAYPFGYVFTRVGGGWAVAPQPVGRGGCAYCPGSPWPVYYLADGSTSVIKIASATMTAPGIASGDLWLTTFPANASLGSAAGTAREYSGTGVPRGPIVRLPAGYGIEAATDRGLLLIPLVNYIPGTIPGTAQPLWDPVTRRTIRTFNCVLSASADDIAFSPRCGNSSRIQLLNLTTGRDLVLALPPDGSASDGVFSPDGRYLALRLQFANGSARLELVTAGTGQVALLPGSWVSSESLTGFGWPGSDDALAAELVWGSKTQVAFWTPGGFTPAVAMVRPGQDPTNLVVG
jgi:hypothetical protein